MHLNARFIGLAALLLIATTAAVLLVGTRGFDRDTPLAFPELEGFGSKTIGGRGGNRLSAPIPGSKSFCARRTLMIPKGASRASEGGTTATSLRERRGEIGTRKNPLG